MISVSPNNIETDSDSDSDSGCSCNYVVDFSVKTAESDYPTVVVNVCF